MSAPGLDPCPACRTPLRPEDRESLFALRGEPYTGTVTRGATFSPCGTYRYTLRRAWSKGPLVAFVGLNPSTADAKQDDPTIRRCIGFAKSWGFGALVMLNLFAYRSTEPDALLRVEDPVGPGNDEVIAAVSEQAVFTVIAWGSHKAARQRAHRVHVELLGSSVCWLGQTQGGHPRHPLYMPADTQPIGGLFSTPAELPLNRKAAA